MGEARPRNISGLAVIADRELTIGPRNGRPPDGSWNTCSVGLGYGGIEQPRLW
jgi:hypothetical protein